MNAYTYKCLVQAYLRSRDSGKAFWVYAEMKKKGYKLDVFAYNMLLNALAKDEKVCSLTPKLGWEFLEVLYVCLFCCC